MSGYKVRITGPGGKIQFEASAPLSEGRKANYDGYQITHMPTSLWAYRNTEGRNWGITGKLVSRTAQEATANASYLDLARAWVLPDFGNTGGTPPILKLFGYRNKNIDGRQVVLTSYDWTFPEDVDYIWQAGQAMPIIGVLSLSLMEVYSASQITGRAWRITPSGGGSFKGGGGGGASSAFWMDFGGAQTTPDASTSAGIGDFSVPDFTPVVNLLSSVNQGTLSVPAAIAGALTSAFGAQQETSSQIEDVTPQLGLGNVNPFVSGQAAYVAAGVVNNVVSQVTQEILADPFARNNGFAPPDIIDDL